MMKHIIHDWSDEYCVKILTHLSAAAARETTLLLFETILPLAIHDPSAKKEGLLEAPSPLLANYGGANDMGYNIDFIVRSAP